MQDSESETTLVRGLVQIGLLLTLTGLMTGCASRTALVIARSDAQFNLSATNKISLAAHAQPRESELALQQALLTALQEHGIELVSPAQADFTLAYWLDDSWKPGKKVIYYYNGGWQNTYPMAQPTFISAGPQGQVMYENQHPIRQRVVDSPYYIQGIRLKIYPKTGVNADPFKAAWEGYIEGGSRVSQKREPILLRTLLNYYGKDFNGRAPLLLEK